MAYVFPNSLPWERLAGPLAAAEDALARLDERVGTSPIRSGWLHRSHLQDACASLWLEGELVHLEDLVLHDARRDVRTPTHEITRAHAVLRARRRIADAKPDWAVSAPGLGALCHDQKTVEAQALDLPGTELEEEERDVDDDAFAAELAAVDALLQRSSGVLARATEPRERDPFVYDPDWDEAERLNDWRQVLDEAGTLPPVLATALAYDAWVSIEPLQHRHWLGPLLCAAFLRARGKARYHLPCLNLALKAVPRERRRTRDGAIRLAAFLEGVTAGTEQGIRDLERWGLARTALLRKLEGRRRSSKLPQLVELVLERGIVSAGMIADELGMTSRAAQDLVGELGLREITGRRRYRAWGII